MEKSASTERYWPGKTLATAGSEAGLPSRFIDTATMSTERNARRSRGSRATGRGRNGAGRRRIENTEAPFEAVGHAGRPGRGGKRMGRGGIATRRVGTGGR